MSDLLSVVQQAQTCLSKAHSLVDKAGCVEPNELNVRGTWLAKAKLYIDLSETQKLFENRDDAMKCLEDLRDNAKKLGPAPISSKIPFGTKTISLASARLMLVDSYLATTWSIYDRLSNVIGRLMGDESVVENSNPADNPKLIENLMAKKNGCFQCFGNSGLLVKLYGVPIYSSYFLRNSFMHDGGMVNNMPILSGSSAAACFELSQEDAEKMNRSIKQRLGNLISVKLRDGDFVAQLKAIHEEMDKMFAGLVEFVVGSFYSQVSLFGERIGVNLSATAIL